MTAIAMIDPGNTPGPSDQVKTDRKDAELLAPPGWAPRALCGRWLVRSLERTARA